jgi:hypothetical protein
MKRILTIGFALALLTAACASAAENGSVLVYAAPT